MSILKDIVTLKRQRGISLVVHNYASPVLFDIADFIGGTLSSILAPGKLQGEKILMITTIEMAAMAKALFPHKTILHPNPAATCTVAQALAGVKKPGWIHINAHPSTVARSEGIFTPEHLPPAGSGVSGEAGIIDTLKQKGYKKLASFPCPVHAAITAEEVQRAKAQGKVVIAHHECRPEVKKLADMVMSTDQMVAWAKTRGDKTVALATETTMALRLRRLGVDAIPTGVHICWAFKSLTPQLVLWGIKNGRWEIEVPPAVAEAVRKRFESLIRARGQSAPEGP